MRAQIQRFSLMKDGWYGPATVDFSETSCCIITGQNGGGKTLTNRMIELVGKWTANPSRFNLREMEKLAQKTGIQRANIVVRSTICKGRDKYVNALPWASEFGLDSAIFPRQILEGVMIMTSLLMLPISQKQTLSLPAQQPSNAGKHLNSIT